MLQCQPCRERNHHPRPATTRRVPARRCQRHQPGRQASRSPGGGDASVHGHARRPRARPAGIGSGVVGDGDQVGHLERGSRDLREAQVHGDLVVELERLAVLHERLEHGRLEPGVAPLGEGVADRSQVGHPRLLEVGEVVAVVDDAHRIGLDEPHPDPVGEVVVVGRRGRIDGQAHAATIQVGTTRRPGAVDRTGGGRPPLQSHP